MLDTIYKLCKLCGASAARFLYAWYDKCCKEYVSYEVYRFGAGRIWLLLITALVTYEAIALFPLCLSRMCTAVVNLNATGMGASNYLAVRIGGHDGAERWRSTGGGGWTGTSYAGVYVEDSACAIAVDNGGGVVIAGNTEGALFESTGEEGHILMQTLWNVSWISCSDFV